METRIKKLRKALGLTQEAFGEQINVGRVSVSHYEKGNNKPSEAVVTLICEKFNVSKDWLLEGKGEMFVSTPKEDEISLFLKSLSSASKDDFRVRLMKALCKMDTEEWQILEKIAANIIGIPYINTIENEDNEEDEAYYEDRGNIYIVPLATSYLSAGKGEPTDVFEVDGEVDASDYPKADFAFKVRGDSMEPKYYSGDTLFIQKQDSINPGEIGAFLYRGEQYVKKLIYEDGVYKLHSLNKKYSDIEIKDDITTYGKVLN